MINIKIYLNNIKKEIDFYIGKTAQDNFHVIDKASETDLWFHIEGQSSCHVVAIIPDGCSAKHMKSIIKNGALLCKENTSKLSKSRNVPVIYCFINNIQKTEIPGCVNIHNTMAIKRIIV